MSRVILLDGGKEVDVFELVELTDEVARVRSPFLFEVGETLSLRIECDGKRHDARARVRGHVGPADNKVTELAIGEDR